MNNDLDNLVVLSRIAFIQGKYEESLKLAKQTLANDSKSSDAHQCAGDTQQVLETYVRTTDKLVHLTVNGEKIISTYDHPYYVKGQGFVSAENLCIGSVLVDSNGEELTVDGLFRESCNDEVATVYNFQVEDYHTYFVGHTMILVHNVKYDVGKYNEMPNEPGMDKYL